MGEFEDLSARAARLWLEFMQAQAKAAATAAKTLPEMTRSLAEAGVPLAAEVNRWMEGTLPAPAQSDEMQKTAAVPQPESLVGAVAPAREQKPRPAPLMRANHRRLKTPTSLARRRARRI